MNADKLADVLRRATDFIGYLLDHSPEDRRDNAIWSDCKAALAEHDAQPAQAAQPSPEHQQLFDMLGAKDQEDAARIIAEHHARKLAQPVGVPDGWVMVPREPTAGMLDAGMKTGNLDGRNRLAASWQMMAYAAPRPPAQPSADAVSIAADISTRPEFAKYESPLILDIVRETLKAARAAEGGE